MNAALAERLGDWQRVRFGNAAPPPGGFPEATTDRVTDAREWPFESAKMINAMLAAWRRLLAAMHVAWDGLSEAERAGVDPPPEAAD